MRSGRIIQKSAANQGSANQGSRTSSVVTWKLVSLARPNEVVIAQSVASRPVAISTRPMRRTVRLQQQSVNPKLLHNVKPILRPNLVLHPVKMILHRLLRQTKVIRYLFVRESFGNQRHDLLLTPR